VGPDHRFLWTRLVNDLTLELNASKHAKKIRPRKKTWSDLLVEKAAIYINMGTTGRYIHSFAGTQITDRQNVDVNN
jgi:hypothetical protein